MAQLPIVLRYTGIILINWFWMFYIRSLVAYYLDEEYKFIAVDIYYHYRKKNKDKIYI